MDALSKIKKLLQNGAVTILQQLYLTRKQPAFICYAYDNSLSSLVIYAMAASKATFIISVNDFSLSSEVDCSEVMK